MDFRRFTVSTHPDELKTDFSPCSAYSLCGGACANHPSETVLAKGFTHAALAILDKVEGDSFQKEDTFIQLEYKANVTKQLDTEDPEFDGGKPLLRHVFFCQFKDGAPVEELIEGYSGLTAVIPNMKAFEWGKICKSPGSSLAYDYIFMTTFFNSCGRDVYLAHPQHHAFAKHIFSFIHKIIVMDFFEEHRRSSSSLAN